MLCSPGRHYLEVSFKIVRDLILTPSSSLNELDFAEPSLLKRKLVRNS